MLDEVLLPSFDVEFLVESRPLARRLHDAGVAVVAGDLRSAPTPTSRPTSPRAPASSSKTTAGAASKKSPRGHARRRRRRSSTCSARRRPADGRQARRTSSAPSSPTSAYLSMAELFGGPLLTEFSRSLTRGARAAVPALLQRRRPRPDPAAQRSRPRRDGQRAGAAQRAPPHQDHGHHRRDAGRDAAGEPADGEPARHPRRADHAGRPRRTSTASRWWTCSRTTSAA